MYRQAAGAWGSIQTSGAWRPHRPSALQQVTYATAPPGQGARHGYILHQNQSSSIAAQLTEWQQLPAVGYCCATKAAGHWHGRQRNPAVTQMSSLQDLMTFQALSC